jgi:hypothetical protein
MKNLEKLGILIEVAFKKSLDASEDMYKEDSDNLSRIADVIDHIALAMDITENLIKEGEGK